jgi:hypothetical protein
VVDERTFSLNESPEAIEYTSVAVPNLTVMGDGSPLRALNFTVAIFVVVRMARVISAPTVRDTRILPDWKDGPSKMVGNTAGSWVNAPV